MKLLPLSVGDEKLAAEFVFLLFLLVYWLWEAEIDVPLMLWHMDLVTFSFWIRRI